MSEKNFRHVRTLRVRYSETDKMGIVYNANYLDWFEVARTELCRSYGVPFTHWEAEGLALPVIECYCRYKSSAFYDDLVELWCRALDVKVHTLMFEYMVVRESDKKLLAEGWTKHACTDTNTGKIFRREHPFYRWMSVHAEAESGAAKV
jgi:acyl-CoA thioester hydrolase